jgi:tetratricopeptide (TPR) repeat protein
LGAGQAYSLYLKGRFFWNKRTVEGTKRSLEYFEKAIEKGPDFAMAYVGMTESYLVLPYYSSVRPKDLIPKARESAIKALEIDNSIAEAHTNLAMLIMYDDRDWGTAEEKMKIALNLNPSYATAHLWYAWLHLWNSRFDDAIQELKKAQESDPLSLVINNDLGVAFFYAREYDKALEQYHKTIEIDPYYIFTYMYLGWGCFVSTKFGPLMIFLKRWFAYNETIRGEKHEYQEKVIA